MLQEVLASEANPYGEEILPEEEYELGYEEEEEEEEENDIVKTIGYLEGVISIFRRTPYFIYEVIIYTPQDIRFWVSNIGEPVGPALET